jgi:NADPH-dependent glutamate synthase beta subunit-like oxidoreductase
VACARKSSTPASAQTARIKELIETSKKIQKDHSITKQRRNEKLKALASELKNIREHGIQDPQASVNLLANWETEKQQFQILLPNGLIALRGQLQDQNKKLKHKAQEKARDILARYEDPHTQISSMERVFLKFLKRDLEASLTPEQRGQGPVDFVNILHGGQSKKIQAVVNRQQGRGGAVVAALEKKETKAEAGVTDIEDLTLAPKHTLSGALEKTVATSSCSGCGTVGCSRINGCGLERETQQGSILGENALKELFMRIRKELPNATDNEIWARADLCIQSGKILEDAEAGIGLKANERKLFANAYEKYAGGKKGTPLMFTKYVCPAPCEDACTKRNKGPFALKDSSVPIKTYELILDSFAEAFGEMDKYFAVNPKAPAENKEHKVAIVGSGPAGLQAALEMARKGFSVTVFEKDDGPGGLTRTGIPSEKQVDVMAEKYTELLKKMGVTFVYNTTATKKLLEGEGGERYRIEGFDTKIIATGVTHAPNWLNINLTEEKNPDLIWRARAKGILSLYENKISLEDAVTHGLVQGITQAMPFLEKFNKHAQAERRGEANAPLPDLTGKTVFAIGSGDTGTDVLHSLGILTDRGMLGKAVPIKRDINLAGEIIGRGYPFSEEAPDEIRQEKLQHLGIAQDRALVAPVDFEFDETGKLTHVWLQNQRLEEPGQEGLSKEYRKLVSDGTPPYREKADEFILALGFKAKHASPLLKEYGIDLTQPDAVEKNMTKIPGVILCGDADPSQLRGREKQWTVVDALASGRDAARQAMEVPQEVSEPEWKQTRGMRHSESSLSLSSWGEDKKGGLPRAQSMLNFGRAEGASPELLRARTTFPQGHLRHRSISALGGMERRHLSLSSDAPPQPSPPPLAPPGSFQQRLDREGDGRQSPPH